jgi:hypothetical protein
MEADHVEISEVRVLAKLDCNLMGGRTPPAAALLDAHEIAPVTGDELIAEDVGDQ